jgi:peptidylprolyl isomerase
MKRISSAGNPWLICLIAVCSVFLVLSGCTSQQPVVKEGDTVKVYYSVSLPGEAPFQSNRNATPLEFTLGTGGVVPGFEEAVLGLSPGQTRTVTVPAEKAYGPYRPELVNTLSTEAVRSSLTELQENKNLGQMDFPETGPVYFWVKENGQVGYLRFTNITPETTTVDENHPLAGKDLVFEITLVEIVEKTGP